jgi:hypothetical protein
MSLKIGGSKSKTSSTSNSTSNSTTTPTVPEWASTLTQGVAGRVGDVNRLDPYSLVAPTNGLQNRAAAGAENLSGSPWNFDGAADLIRGVARHDANTYAPIFGQATDAQSASLLDNLDAYMSPYRRDVVDAALDDYDFGAGQTRAQQDLDLAGSGAFGGSGAALTRSMTEDALTRGRATTSANLLDQMFQRGTALSADDANRRQQVSLANAAAANEAVRFGAEATDRVLQRQLDAARGLVDLSTAYDANQRGNIATQASMGAMQRDVDEQQRQAPITHAQQVVAMLQGLPINLFTGQQTQETKSGSSTGKTSELNFSAGVSAKDAIAGMTGIPL